MYSTVTKVKLAQFLSHQGKSENVLPKRPFPLYVAGAFLSNISRYVECRTIAPVAYMRMNVCASLSVSTLCLKISLN